GRRPARLLVQELRRLPCADEPRREDGVHVRDELAQPAGGPAVALDAVRRQRPVAVVGPARRVVVAGRAVADEIDVRGATPASPAPATSSSPPACAPGGSSRSPAPW